MAKQDSAPEAVQQDEVPAVDENAQVEDLSADQVAASEPAEADQNAADQQEAEAEAQQPARKVVETKENTYTYRHGQGNTNPDDFSVFDDNGNFVEKHDR